MILGLHRIPVCPNAAPIHTTVRQANSPTTKALSRLSKRYVEKAVRPFRPLPRILLESEAAANVSTVQVTSIENIRRPFFHLRRT